MKRLAHRLRTLPPQQYSILALIGSLGLLVILLMTEIIRSEDMAGGLRLGFIASWIALASVCYLAVEARRRDLPSHDEDLENPPWTYWGMAFGAWTLGIILSLWLYLNGSTPEFRWTRYPYFDKRWLVVLYWSSFVSAVVLPQVFRFYLNWLRRERRANSSEPAPTIHDRVSSSSPRRALPRVAIGVAAACFLFGPPWNLERSVRPINPHETVHWSGLQAIEHGHTPYLGAASNNYGPGNQASIYAYMKLTDQFSIKGFRETFAVSVWLSLVLFAAMTFALLPLNRAALTLFLALLISPLSHWNWTGGGVLTGFWGWANPLRVLGPTLLALGVCLVISYARTLRGLIFGSMTLGVLWAGLAYFSQENLLGGAATLILVTILLVTSGTISLRSSLVSAASAGAGVATLSLPIGIYYGLHGGLVEFWTNYSMVPKRFMQGYANTPYRGDLTSDPYSTVFFALPYLVALAAIVSLHGSGRPGNILSREKMVLAASSIALLVSNSSSLLRADGPHVSSGLFALPVVLVLSVFDLSPSGATRLQRWILRFCALGAAWALLLPVWQEAPKRLQKHVVGRVASFEPSHRRDLEPSPHPVDKRFGKVLASTRANKPAVALLRKVNELAGDGATFVQVELPLARIKIKSFAYAGMLYFGADLVPAPILMERSDMVADSDQLQAFRKHFRDHIDEVEVIVSMVASSPEIEIFSKAKAQTCVTTLREPLDLYIFDSRIEALDSPDCNALEPSDSRTRAPRRRRNQD